MTVLERLKHVSNISVSNVDKKTTDGDHTVRLCNYTDVYYNTRITEDLDFMEATATSQQIRQFGLRSGDILMTKDSETADEIGISALVVRDMPGVVCGYHLAVIRPRLVRIHPAYLYWALASTRTREQFAVAATGITRFGLRQDSIGSVQIRVPPLDQQRAIARYLDAETDRIDALITKKGRMIEVLDERAKSVVNERFASPIVYGVDGRPVGLSGVTCVRLGQVASIHSGLTLDEGRVVGPGALTLPYLRVANVQDGSLDLSDVKEVTVPRAMADRCGLETGDVLMTEGGDPDKLGRGAVWRGTLSPCLHQNHIFAVRPGPSLLAEYLALVTRSSYARAYFEMTASKTTGIASTSTTKIASFRVPLPNITEQEETVRYVYRRLADIQRVRGSVDRQIDLVVEHRQALITSAVVGEIHLPEVAA